MRLDDFDYPLPQAAIAATPMRPRHQAHMLDMTGETLVDRRVIDLPECLNQHDLLVVNNTQVLAARLFAQRVRDTSTSTSPSSSTASKVEITLLRPLNSIEGEGEIHSDWLVLAKPARKLAVGDALHFATDFTAEVIAVHADGCRVLRFNKHGDALHASLDKYGVMPLPPYIPRPSTKARDKSDYQTIFARHKGAVAAPTAGLHFDDTLLNRLANAKIQQTEITLHVGGGTFLPVKHADPRHHTMHKEWGHISKAAADAINHTRAKGGRIVAVGTTSLRLLETCMHKHKAIQPYTAETDLFILPGFRFQATDMLLTNFHLPKSTLLMLVMAFAGSDKIRHAYHHAMHNGYRFFSYGDACLMARQ